MSQPVTPRLPMGMGVERLAAPRTSKNLCGLCLVTGAALCFGVVAAFVKATHLPTLVLQMCRSTIEWVLGVAATLAVRHWRVLEQSLPTSEREPLVQKEDSTGSTTTDLTHLLFGPPELRGWIVLRAFLYWLFLACWWSALHIMPIGDATAIVYVSPLFTAIFARLFLGEEIDWVFYPVVALDGLGLLLICRPSWLFPDPGGLSSDEGDYQGEYYLGSLIALCSAVVSGLLPICTRKSKACNWTAITHSASLLSVVVFTPTAIFIWTKIDPHAEEAISVAIGKLIGVWPDAGSVHSVRTTNHFVKWLLVLGATGSGYLALAMQTVGYQLEQVSRACIMNVLEIPFSFCLQAIIFGEVVSPLGVAGAAFIVAGTLLNVIRRTQKE